MAERRARLGPLLRGRWLAAAATGLPSPHNAPLRSHRQTVRDIHTHVQAHTRTHKYRQKHAAHLLSLSQRVRAQLGSARQAASKAPPDRLQSALRPACRSICIIICNFSLCSALPALVESFMSSLANLHAIRAGDAVRRAQSLGARLVLQAMLLVRHHIARAFATRGALE